MHPGYGFLSENAEFAQAVIDAGLTWIGPPPEAIDSLGDKVKARHIAAKAGAPLVPGTPDPVEGADEVVAFAKEHGLPVAIKAAYGGGGRGLKVARTIEEIPELFDSAVREAVAAFGRGECFVERYLDKPRHVETQCLADQHGNVVVVSTRDCSLQRRHQKLVEEAPAPFLTDAQNAELVRASKAILTRGRLRRRRHVRVPRRPRTAPISFLEVNTRLQVEHPVTEEVTGIDLVREQFRIADGEALGYDDPALRGHSFEFRINGEDAGRGFLPAPGVVATFEPPSGPGVRLDSGVVEGDVIGGAFDSMLAKLIVTGATGSRRSSARAARWPSSRSTACRRCCRSTARSSSDPAFAPDGRRAVHGPHPLDRDRVRQHDRAVRRRDGRRPRGAGERQSVVVEVGGKRLEVVLPGGLVARSAVGAAKKKAPASLRWRQGRRRRVRRLAHRADAGHHRQDRRRGGPAGRRGRARRGPRGDEDGAADHRPQGRHHHRPVGRGRPDRHHRRRHRRDQGLTPRHTGRKALSRCGTGPFRRMPVCRGRRLSAGAGRRGRTSSWRALSPRRRCRQRGVRRPAGVAAGRWGRRG